VGVTRRDFIRSATAVSVGALAGVGAYGAAYERHQILRIVARCHGPWSAAGPRRSPHRHDHRRAPQLGGPAADVTRAVMLLKEAAPDIVVLGGDYISFFDRTYARRSRIAGAAGERAARVIRGAGQSRRRNGNAAALSARGFTVLKDQRTSLTVKRRAARSRGIRFWTRSPAKLRAF
jgi:hypothetical protein